MRELVVTPSFSSGVNSQLYLASFSLRPNDLRKYIYGGLDYPICFKSKCFDEKFRAELSNHAEVLVDLLIEKKSKSFNELHKTNFSVKYWRILLGPWVHQFVHQLILFDRILQFGIGRTSSETVLVQTISPAQWPQFQTTLDAITAAKHDFFIQILFSFIVKSRYRDKFVHRDVSCDLSSDDSSNITRERFITFFRVILSKFILFISSNIRGDLLLASEVPENKTIDFKLWWASNFRWVPDFITDGHIRDLRPHSPFPGEEITQTNDDFDLVDVAFDHFVPSVL